MGLFATKITIISTEDSCVCNNKEVVIFFDADLITIKITNYYNNKNKRLLQK
jgi:hypothetical protein